MRRSGRNFNDCTVPAFYTRSKVQRSYVVNSVTPRRLTNGQQQKYGVQKQVWQPREIQQKVKEIGECATQQPKEKETVKKQPEKNAEQEQLEVQLEKAEPKKDDQMQNNEIKENYINLLLSKKEEEPKPIAEVELVVIKEEDSVINNENKDKPEINQNEVTEKEDPSKGVSASTKALKKLHELMIEKGIWRKKQKIPLAVRRRRLNQRLNKILTPKSGLNFLHEFKPECVIKVHQQSGINPPMFVANVEYNEKVVASGQGTTKLNAKNVAAENAIKALVAEALSNSTSKSTNSEGGAQGDIQSGTDNNLVLSLDDLSLAGLASFAMYKMFSEWQSEGTDLPLPFLQKKKVTLQKSNNQTASKPASMRKKLPPDAEKLHPSFLLNTMRPGILSTELERYTRDNVSVVIMGYEIDGKMYTGSSTNKKEARKKAAKAALSDLYGLTYND